MASKSTHSSVPSPLAARTVDGRVQVAEHFGVGLWKPLRNLFGASARRAFGVGGPARLTEAVAKEIELKTPYKVVHRPDADSILSARITSETKRVVAEEVNDIPRNIETDLTVQVNWYDRRGEYLVRDSRFNFSPVAFSADQNADFTPEAGQSVATAHQEAIQRLAEQIVSQMESRW